jgi:imidazolonepropionase-like amidohydrolase
MLKKYMLCFPAFALLPFIAQAQTILHCERLIDGINETVQLEQTVRIQNNKILAIEAGYAAVAENETLVKLTGKTCMPGLMDMHVHITSELNPKRSIDRFRLDPQDDAYASVRYAERTLMAGFTTVRDLGSKNNLSISMRNAINKGQIIGPRIYTAGKSLATTGGHADPTNGVNSTLRGDPGPRQGVINSVEDIKKAIRQRYKEGADLIKITATGGVLSQASSGENPQFTTEELEAIMSIAKDYNFKVAAHAHGTSGMQRAIKAGIDSIEHGTYMDKATMKLMKKHGTTYVPTIIAGKFVAEKAKEEGYFSEIVRPKAATIGPLIQNTFRDAYAMGVKIAFGTDSGVSAHGDNWKEFRYMVEAGMPAMEAIQSATLGGATLLGIEETHGTLTSGKVADIIAVEDNPISNINNMGLVRFVMKDGIVYKNNL